MASALPKAPTARMPERPDRVLAHQQHDSAREQERQREVRRRHERDVHPGGSPAARRRRAHPVCTPVRIRRDARHHETDGPLGGLRLRHLADDAPVVHDQDAVRERQDLVELDRDQEDRLAGVAEGHQPAVDELDGADVHAARRLADQQQIRVPVELPREHDLLLVAAREGRRGKRPVRGPHVVLRSLATEARRDRAPPQPEVAVVGRLVVVAEDGALAGAEGDDEAHPLAVLGDVGQAEPAHAPAESGCAWSVMSWPRHRIRPDFTGRMPASASSSSDWPLPATPAMPDDLASPHREADALDALHSQRVLDDEVGHLEHRVAGLGRRLVHAQVDPAADHQLGELLRRGLGGRAGSRRPGPVASRSPRP